MSQHHHQGKEEQIYNKAHGTAPFHSDKRPYPRILSMEPQDIFAEVAADDDSIRLQAYQIHQEKGGSDLDNWLEAERILRNAPGTEYKKPALLY